MTDTATGAESDGERDPVEVMLEDFLERRRQGEVPSLSAYLQAHSHLDSQVRQVLSTLLMMENMSPDSASQERLPGRIGDFRPIREIGRGGMGVVYEAEQLSLGRRVALKVMTSHRVLDSTQAERFRREAGVASRIQHPGICTVFGAGVEDDVPYIAMALVEGRSLAELISEARMSGDGSTFIEHTPQAPGSTSVTPVTRAEVFRTLRMMEDAARAIHAAHEAGVVHRDLKPGNIMVTPDGNPIILDFGLAADLALDAPALTRTGDVFGTPAYMPPEQLSGQRTDRRADVFALGVTLYEALTLHRPFNAPTRHALYEAIRESSPPHPRRYNPEIPADTAVVLETAMEKDPERRYRTARAFAEDLKRLRESRPVLARPVPVRIRLLRWMRRHPAAAVLVGILAVCLPTIASLVTYTMATREEVRTGQEELRQRKLEGLLESGYLLMAERLPKKARPVFEDAVAFAPESPEAILGLAWSYSPTRNQIKPGHWFSAVQSTKANNYEFPKGDLEARCVNNKNETYPLPITEFQLATARPVNLPKGQQKHFDLLFYANPMGRGTGAINLSTSLRPRGGGRQVDWHYEATTKMRGFQNHFVVLADRPDNYQFLKTLRSVKPQRSSDEYLQVELDYFVKLPKGKLRVDLPTHPLTWTHMSHILWDDFEPEILSTAQQQSLIDWLHWGGQLIINGPRTLDRLNSSVFAEYLPAKAAATVGSVTDEQIQTLNDNWSFNEVDAGELESFEDEKERPIALELEPTDGSRFIPRTAELVAEKTVGRGRVVVTAFNLPHKYFQTWDSYDSFFNACLLGRPARRFWSTANDTTIVESWSGKGMNRDDPRITSSLRYFSRDAVNLTTRQWRPGNTNASQVQLTRTPAIESGDLKVVLANRRDEEQSGRMAPGIPGIGVSVVGPKRMSLGTEETFTVTVQNNTGTLMNNLFLEINGDESLQIVRASTGYVPTINNVVLRWGIPPLQPGTSSFVEVVGRIVASSGVADGEEQPATISVRAIRDRFVKTRKHYVDVVDDEGMHDLDRVATQAYAVNGFAKNDVAGVAGWSDASEVSQEARASLRRSSGISVPSREFIAKVLGLYLLVLVPLNWVLFRIMGRVEWAWAAVPLIAIGGGIAVIQAAQLDIGFARSRTEIALVEMHPGYDRAHVTRYIGFYTSLSSDYKVSGEEESTLIQPFDASDLGRDKLVSLYQGTDVALTGFSVISNSTGMVHGEQMISLGGGFSLDDASGELVLRNDSNQSLKGAAIVRRNEQNRVQAAWVGDLGTKEKKTDIRFEPLTTVELEFEQWNQTSATSKRLVEGELNIRMLMDLATDPKRLGTGETVLVGWHDEVLPGIVVRPSASQVTARTLFVVHLKHEKRPEPKRDMNSFAVLDRDAKEREAAGGINSNF